MFARSSAVSARPWTMPFPLGRSKPSRVETDFQALLARMSQRVYPETMPALAAYWLKAVYASGYEARAWRELNGHLERALAGSLPGGEAARQSLCELQGWIRQAAPLLRKTAETPAAAPGAERPALDSERLSAYVGTLLNEWLPVELAHLLVNENESGAAPDDDIPALAIGRALERILVRERLTAATLEKLLDPGLLSPRYIYAAHLEILRDVILALLRRTSAPPLGEPRATLFCAASDWPIEGYANLVRGGFHTIRAGAEEGHVPISAAQALELMHGGEVRLGSIVVTSDGRWWESEKIQSGERHSIVYRPKGVLRIDYSAGHAALRVPWPEAKSRWSGAVGGWNAFEVFGREWRVSAWEQDAERIWLHLTFSRILREPVAPAESRFRRSRPAGVDIAWSALENALTTSIAEKSLEPIEQLRHSDLIPLGRAFFGLTEAVVRRGRRKMEEIETRLRAIGYLEAQMPELYGRAPWRVVPKPVRSTFLRAGSRPALRRLLNEVFDALPEALNGPTSRSA